MKIVDLMEYAVLLAFIYTIFYGPSAGKEMPLYAATLGFFLLSGSSWAVSDRHLNAMAEYEKLALPMQAMALLIGTATLIYVWVL